MSAIDLYNESATTLKLHWQGDADLNGTGDPNDRTSNGNNGTVVGTVAAAVWDELRASHTDAGTFGENVVTTGSSSLTAGSIADAVWDELRSAHTNAGSFGQYVNTTGSAPTAAAVADAVWDEARSGHTTVGTFGEGVASAQGSVTGSVASVTAGVTLADDAITAAKFDESTAYPVKFADSGSNKIARTGADGDTLETLSDEVAQTPKKNTSYDITTTNGTIATTFTE